MVTGNNAENYEDQQAGYGYGVRRKERKSIHEFRAAMKIAVANTLFKKRISH